MPRRSAPKTKVRDAGVSRARVCAAAAEEFAARGFDGAKVDRIAERAGMSKGMLYYHFAGKAALYRTVVGDMFASTAAALRDLRAAGGTPERQLTAFVEVVAREGQARPHFPAMWLRELADGGRHLGERNVGDISSIITTLAGILGDGEAAGRFRPVPPFLAQLGIVGPLFMFMATAPMRGRVASKMKRPVRHVSPESLVSYVQAMSLGALTGALHAGRRTHAGHAGHRGHAGRAGGAGRKGNA